MIDWKECTKCKYARPLSKFSKSKQTKDGLACWCKDCKRVADGEYRKRNKERLNAQKRKHYRENKAEIAKRAKIYREKNSETIKKKKNESYTRVRKLWKDFIAENILLQCVRCGYDKCYEALDFHHTEPDNKKFSIAHRNMCAFNDKNKKILLDEIEKCVILCANCHRELHAGGD